MASCPGGRCCLGVYSKIHVIRSLGMVGLPKSHFGRPWSQKSARHCLTGIKNDQRQGSRTVEHQDVQGLRTSKMLDPVQSWLQMIHQNTSKYIKIHQMHSNASNT